LKPNYASLQSFDVISGSASICIIVIDLKRVIDFVRVIDFKTVMYCFKKLNLRFIVTGGWMDRWIKRGLLHPV